MKKPDRAAPSTRRMPFMDRVRAFRKRLFMPLNRLGIRGRVFLYFLAFTAALLALLWIFQIALLSDFYQLQKTEMLNASLDTLARNIDNDDLQLLSDRLAQTNDVCVLMVNERSERIISSDAARDCVIHRMSGYDLNRYQILADSSQRTIYRIFDMGSLNKSNYDEKRFDGRVPPADNGAAKSMVAIRTVHNAAGEKYYIFINAIITPVDATVQTLRSQYLFIAILMVLLSFGISLVLSRRIAKPIIDTNAAARSLSEGRFEPEMTNVSYREILQLNRTLRQAARDLCRVEEMQRELIANISHDLRTPLTLIEGYAEAMRDLPGENTPENMQVIIEETRRLSSLVNTVLDYSTGRNGQGAARPEVYNLTQSIRSILGRYQKLTGQDGYHIRFEADRSVLVMADEVKIGQVIYNLINNALTYTGADKTVTVAQTEREHRVRVEVRDTGEGIDEQELPFIWSRYYRGQNTHKRAAVGSGLGLSIVKGILDGYSLRYGVQSSRGKGTTFWFELPIEAEMPDSGGLGSVDS